uniref:Uncharacterized protein n=1 Tax=Anguilla anguilla TaxID=7936 RepID=A0A0E9PNW4_ANGAN
MSGRLRPVFSFR